MSILLLIDTTAHENERFPRHFILNLHDYPYDEEPRMGHVLPLDQPVAKDAHTCHFGGTHLTGIYTSFFSVIVGQVRDVVPEEKQSVLPAEITLDDYCYKMYIQKYCEFHPRDPVKRLTPIPLY